MGRQRADGAMTVFFALTLTLLCALFLSIAESARTQSARLYLTQAANASMDSLFSQYHRALWEEYRLLGLEHYGVQQIEEEFKDFLQPYFEVKSWYPMQTESVRLLKEQRLTDEEGRIFEEEVLSYMKYGIAASVMEAGLAEMFLQDTEEAQAIAQISDLYDGHAKEAAELEKALERINACLILQEEAYEAAKDGASHWNEESVRREIYRMQDELRRLPSLVSDYEMCADTLSTALEGSREQFEAAYAEGRLKKAAYEGLHADIEAYESYVSADGERRREVEAFRERAADGIICLDGILTQLDEIEDYIDAWEPADEDDSIDYDALWRPVIRALMQYEPLRLSGAHGIADKEKEGFLEQVKHLLEGEFMRLLLPEGEKISDEALQLADSPSASCYSGADHCRLPLLDRIFVAEYLAGVMHYFGRDSLDAQMAVRDSDRVAKDGNALALEYILQGEASDMENLTGTARDLLTLRTGLNLLYLYRDSAKRTEARALAAAITGVLGFTPLVSLMTFFVLSIWAIGQALCDVRDLLHGRRVPFLHSAGSFYLSLEGLLEIGKTGSLAALTDVEEKQGSGLDYESYLKLFLFARQGVQQDYRSMDMIQLRLRTKQADFELQRCLYAAEAEATVHTNRLFTRLGLVGAAGNMPLLGGYDMRVSTAYSY